VVGDATTGAVTSARKLAHLDACLSHPVEYQTRTTGLERLDLPYRALPETDLREIDLRTQLLGRTLRAPLLIGAMTGGPDRSAGINRNLAEAAQELGVGLVLGSQRVMLEDPDAAASFRVRPSAPDVLLLGNLGVAQLNNGYGAGHVRRAIEAIDADGLALHTNPLQEAMQPAGDADFAGLTARLHELAAAVEYPLVLKEVGHGIAGPVAAAAADAGVAAVDVAGAGGTSWCRVEQYVRYGAIRHPDLAEWGIPTADALRAARAAVPELPLVGSGGIRTGLDAAKAIALGANVVAVALPLLEPALRSADAVVERLETLLWELRVAMHCAGVTSVAGLRGLELVER
jgi:isopentenyl-diphosphate Delta-isomerase